MVTLISKVTVSITFWQTTILENPLVISIYPWRATDVWRSMKKIYTADFTMESKFFIVLKVEKRGNPCKKRQE